MWALKSSLNPYFGNTFLYICKDITRLKLDLVYIIIISKIFNILVKSIIKICSDDTFFRQETMDENLFLH